MSAPTRVFIARLTGASVFDPSGDQLGKIRDAVATLRAAPRPPRIIGLVLEVQPRRRIFVPMTRVTSIDADGVVVSGLLNLRRFEQRTGEMLVVGELLDSHVTLVEDESEVTLLDVGMEQLRTRDWEVGKVYVQRKGKTLRRRGEQFVVDWNEITGLSLGAEDQGTTRLLESFEKLRPADLAHALQALSAKRRGDVVAALGDERLADVLGRDDRGGVGRHPRRARRRAGRRRARGDGPRRCRRHSQRDPRGHSRPLARAHGAGGGRGRPHAARSTTSTPPAG